jgi:hypothetical protein
MHSIMPDFLGIVAQSGHSQKSNAMIGVIVCHPRGRLVPELHLRADEERVPSDHLIQVTGFHCDVMQRGFNRWHVFSRPVKARVIL